MKSDLLILSPARRQWPALMTALIVAAVAAAALGGYVVGLRTVVNTSFVEVVQQ